MSLSTEDELALGKAELIANQVVSTAIKHANQLVAFEVCREPYLDTIIAQHVKAQLAVLQNGWLRDKDEKVAGALQDMGTGLQKLGASCGKHSLHVKLVEP
jgi:hypothetical protein